MNHEMPVMTEEKRQALIAFNQAIITQHEAYAIPEANWPEHVRLIVDSARIALASLESSSLGYVREGDFSLMQFRKSHSCVEVAVFRDRAFSTDHEVYTAPPVPVMPWDDDLQRVFGFAKFVIKCVRKNREYSPLSSQEPDEIDAILRKIEEDK